MLEAIPSQAAYCHDAFALAPADLQRARDVAARAAHEGWASARAALFEWAAEPAPPRPVRLPRTALRAEATSPR